jgi:hypothetical protein
MDRTESNRTEPLSESAVVIQVNSTCFNFKIDSMSPHPMFTGFDLAHNDCALSCSPLDEGPESNDES